LTVTARSRHNGLFGAGTAVAAPVAFSFARVLPPSATQAAVYNETAAQAVQSALDGYNACLMVYGQTGSGKTYTMSGSASYAGRGLIPRALSALFAQLAARSDGGAGVSVRVSFCELYNEAWGDLLAPRTPASALTVLEGPPGEEGSAEAVSLRGLASRPCVSEEDALAALFEGEHNRVVGVHALNRASSRSHAVFTVSLEQRDAVPPAPPAAVEDDVLPPPQQPQPARLLRSKLHFVDLAGSERLLKTRSEGVVAAEAKHINKSLSFLEQTVLALSQKASHIPYRSSKLTHLLKDALGGNCKCVHALRCDTLWLTLSRLRSTMLIANIWGTKEQLDETMSTCRFAQRMACVTGAVRRNVTEEPGVIIARLRRTVASLRAQLAATQGGEVPLDAADGEEGDDEVVDEAAVEARVRAFFTCERDTATAHVEAQHLVGVAAGGAARAAMLAARRLFMQARQLKPEEELPGSDGQPQPRAPVPPLSAPPPVAQPPTADVAAPAGSASEPSAPAAVAAALLAELLPPTVVPAPVPDRDAAFQEYKLGVGAEHASLLAHNKAALKEQRRAIKALAERINAAKLEIDALKAGAAPDAAGGDDDADRRARLCAAKRAYKQAHEEHTFVRSDAEYTASLVETCARELVAGFEAWFVGMHHARTADAQPLQPTAYRIAAKLVAAAMPAEVDAEAAYAEAHRRAAARSRHR